MRRVILFIATSIDGYVADSNGDVSWLGGDGSDTNAVGSYPEFINGIDTVILGYTTYNQIVSELAPSNWPYSDHNTYLITHRDVAPTEQGVVVWKDSLETLIKKLKAQQGKDIWVCGGASIANQMIESGLIDVFHLSIIPTILGSGIRLFENLSTPLKLKLESTQTYNGISDLVYVKR